MKSRLCQLEEALPLLRQLGKLLLQPWIAKFLLQELGQRLAHVIGHGLQERLHLAHLGLQLLHEGVEIRLFEVWEISTELLQKIVERGRKTTVALLEEVIERLHHPIHLGEMLLAQAFDLLLQRLEQGLSIELSGSILFHAL